VDSGVGLHMGFDIEKRVSLQTTPHFAEPVVPVVVAPQIPATDWTLTPTLPGPRNLVTTPVPVVSTPVAPCVPPVVIPHTQTIGMTVTPGSQPVLINPVVVQPKAALLPNLAKGGTVPVVTAKSTAPDHAGSGQNLLPNPIVNCPPVAVTPAVQSSTVPVKAPELRVTSEKAGDQGPVTIRKTEVTKNSAAQPTGATPTISQPTSGRPTVVTNQPSRTGGGVLAPGARTPR